MPQLLIINAGDHGTVFTGHLPQQTRPQGLVSTGLIPAPKNDHARFSGHDTSPLPLTREPCSAPSLEPEIWVRFITSGLTLAAFTGHMFGLSRSIEDT